MLLVAFSRGAAVAALSLLPTLTLAEIVVSDGYARTSRPNAPTGAAFVEILNRGSEADRLIEVKSDIAARVEFHTHIDQGNGVMQMTQIEGGREIAPGSSYKMQRGGDHIMFMGLNQPLEQGGTVTVILTFEQAGDVQIDIPVDNERMPEH